MIKKTLPLLIVGILVLSGLGAAANLETNEISENSEIVFEIKNFNLDLANPTFNHQDEFITIELAQSEAFMSTTGEPMLPVITKTFDFPVGTTIDSVNVDIDWERYDLDRKVTPTPIIVPNSVEVNPAILEERKFNEEVYSSAELYPAEPYSIRMGAGLKDMEHVIFVNVKCYPQYSPANNYVEIPTTIDIDIEYATAEAPVQNEEQYDLIIVTHDLFEDELQSLVQHKENIGITTKLVTVDEIYENYEGEGDWEEIKMYLADHVLDWDTKFVLLAGGHKGQTNEWYVPDFRSHCWDPEDAYDPPYDETYSSDLYYADVYYADQYGYFHMDDWDSNGNGIYAEGPDMPSGTDQMDFYPDVHLGRLPMRYEWEADVAVNKIIDYENNADDSWFKKAILCGGDGFPPERYGDVADPDLWEGEIVCDAFADLLARRGVESTKCYCSDQGDIQVKESKDVYNEVNKEGCGFAHYTGHANAFSLGSYTPGTGISPPPLVPFYTGFNLLHYNNDGKFPFMICEGCHNAQFDVTGQDLISYLVGAYPDFQFARYEWIPHDSSSWLVLQEGGGAIGVIGNTALGLGGLNNGCTRFVGGWIMLRFAEAWGVDGEDYMGSVWTTGVNGYIDNFPISKDTGDRKTVEERALIGDPSVRLGGYGSSLSEIDESESEEIYGPVSVSTPTWSVGDSWTYALDNIDIDLTPIEGRSITLQLSTGDIILEVTDVTSNSYVASIISDNVDVTFGGIFDFHVATEDNINIPKVSFDNIQLDGKITFEKQTLAIKDIDLGLNLELMENLDTLGIQFPSFAEFLRPFIEIPLNINVNVEFDDAIALLQFPLENGDIWGFPANTITVTIDGSAQSFWLRLLNFVNKFIEIVPPEFAKYLPNIDISEILNDLGIESTYQIDMAEVPANLLPYHDDTTPLFEVMGSENIGVKAGQFNAVKMSIADDNGKLYYSELSLIHI